MAGAFTTAMLALSPDSFWLCGEAGATLVDSVGGKNLTVRGSPAARGVVLPAPFVGVDPGINFSNSPNGPYAITTSPLTQIATNKFSIVGMMNGNGSFPGASQPTVCASFSGGHTDPFYIFNVGNRNLSNTWQYAVDTTGTLVFVDTGVAFTPTAGWQLFGFTYDGTTTKLWINNVAVYSAGAISGNVHDTMGSFAINNIPALDSTSFSGPLSAASFGYWHDHVVSSGEMAALYAAAQTAPPTGPTTIFNPGSVSAALRV